MANISEEIREQIAQGRTEIALKNLSAYLKDKDVDLRNQVTGLLSRWRDNKKKYNMNVLQSSDWDRIQSQISYAVLDLLADIDIAIEQNEAWDDATSQVKGDGNIIIQHTTGGEININQQTSDKKEKKD